MVAMKYAGGYVDAMERRKGIGLILSAGDLVILYRNLNYRCNGRPMDAQKP